MFKHVAEPEAYLQANEWIQSDHPAIQAKAKEFVTAEDAYLFVRDQIAHSYDIRATKVNGAASEVLEAGHGICYAKAHLLAALLRAMGIPAGIAYQKLVLFDDPKDGYALHALNTFYDAARECWFRIDARGNKPGVDAQFDLERERLAFPLRPELDETDYPYNFAAPPKPIVDFYLLQGDICDLYSRNLPTHLDEK